MNTNCFFYSNNSIENTKLTRTNNYRNNNIKLPNTVLETTKKSKVYKTLYATYIDNFIKSLIENNANFNYSLFERNIKNLMIFTIRKKN